MITNKPIAKWGFLPGVMAYETVDRNHIIDIAEDNSEPNAEIERKVRFASDSNKY